MPARPQDLHKNRTNWCCIGPKEVPSENSYIPVDISGWDVLKNVEFWVMWGMEFMAVGPRRVGVSTSCIFDIPCGGDACTSDFEQFKKISLGLYFSLSVLHVFNIPRALLSLPPPPPPKKNHGFRLSLIELNPHPRSNFGRTHITGGCTWRNRSDAIRVRVIASHRLHHDV